MSRLFMWMIVALSHEYLILLLTMPPGLPFKWKLWLLASEQAVFYRVLEHLLKK